MEESILSTFFSFQKFALYEGGYCTSKKIIRATSFDHTWQYIIFLILLWFKHCGVSYAHKIFNFQDMTVPCWWLLWSFLRYSSHPHIRQISEMKKRPYKRGSLSWQSGEGTAIYRTCVLISNLFLSNNISVLPYCRFLNHNKGSLYLSHF
jgi:hypothetical protein